MATTRTIIFMLTLPETMFGDDVETLHRKLQAQSETVLCSLAQQAYDGMRNPDNSPELLAAKLLAEGKRITREG